MDNLLCYVAKSVRKLSNEAGYASQILHLNQEERKLSVIAMTSNSHRKANVDDAK